MSDTTLAEAIEASDKSLSELTEARREATKEAMFRSVDVENNPELYQALADTDEDNE